MENSVRQSSFGLTDLPKDVRRKYRNAYNHGFMKGYGTERWRKSFVGAFLTRYPERANILAYMSEMLGHSPTWKDITDFTLEDFRRYLLGKMCASSVRSSLAMVKALLNSAKGEVEIKAVNYNRVLTVKKQPSQHIFLTSEEIVLVDGYVPRSARESECKRVFMVELLTGARYSDAQLISRMNISGDYIEYVSEKTKELVSVPMHAMLEKYLTPAGTEGLSCSLSAFNGVVKGICRACGLSKRVALYRAGEKVDGEKWEFVSSHTGRRSFATNLFLHGVDISTIQRFMGHSSSSVTEGYICEKRPVTDDIMSFFK